MTRTRQYLAQRAQLQRNLRKKLIEEREAARRLQISETMLQIKEILEDRQFVELLLIQKVKSAPECIFRYSRPAKGSMADHEIADAILAFVAAWKFLFPILNNVRMSDYLERAYPGFVAGIKDTFITLVMDGPFPGMRRTPVRPGHFS